MNIGWYALSSLPYIPRPYPKRNYGGVEY